MLSLIILLAFIVAAFATKGVDVSQLTSSSSWSCAKSNGYSFAIVRVYKSTGAADSNGPANINNAWNAGFAHVDGYIFPCYSCGNAAKQVDDTISYLANHAIIAKGENEIIDASYNTTTGVKYGMLWFDIEGSSYWSTTKSNNVNFLQAMVNEAKAKGVSVGIYSSASQWSAIMGSNSQFSSLPLWYAHYDNNPSYSDFSSFGGWTKPAMKQYYGDASFCSAGWDKNYY